MEATIRGIGMVGAFGAGVDAFSDALVLGERRTRKVALQFPGRQEEAPCYRAETARLDEFIPKASLRRVDHYARMGLLAAALALKDAGGIEIKRDRLGIVIATGYGASATTSAFLDSFINDGDTSSSPTHFSNSVHNAAAAHISILLKVPGPCLTVSQFETSFASSLLTAMTWLEETRVDLVLLGSVDEYCDLLGYCWRRFFGEWSGHEVDPFTFDRQSAIPGEGSAFFLLSRPEGGEGAYGRIIDVETGNLKERKPSLSRKGLLVIGADGHRQCGKAYAELLDEAIPTVSFSPVYGSFPTNSAFDTAAAALILKNGRALLSAGTPWRAVPPGWGDSFPDVVQCLKIGMEKDFGLITLARI
jgi:3-oxoacyl-[acyl-carrier-protein] synthase II